MMLRRPAGLTPLAPLNDGSSWTSADGTDWPRHFLPGVAPGDCVDHFSQHSGNCTPSNEDHQEGGCVRERPVPGPGLPHNEQDAYSESQPKKHPVPDEGWGCAEPALDALPYARPLPSGGSGGREVPAEVSFSRPQIE